MNWTIELTNRANNIMSRIESRYDFKWMAESDRNSTISNIEHYIDDGWNDEEIYSYLICTEEVDPCLAEDEALKRMDAIIKRVRNRGPKRLWLDDRCVTVLETIDL